uniref:Protein kinase domain-containing protein n=1 Tax=Caenorhabditis tropicalis TaxID=1561998 RepID=A0A1I7TC16_9PELO
MSDEESVMIIEDEDEIQPLPIISQKYRLIRELNRGSYGVVYLGIDISVNPPRELAIKAFNKNIPEFLSSAELECTTLRIFNSHQGIVK